MKRFAGTFRWAQTSYLWRVCYNSISLFKKSFLMCYLAPCWEVEQRLSIFGAHFFLSDLKVCMCYTKWFPTRLFFECHFQHSTFFMSTPIELSKSCCLFSVLADVSYNILTHREKKSFFPWKWKLQFHLHSEKIQYYYNTKQNKFSSL